MTARRGVMMVSFSTALLANPPIGTIRSSDLVCPRRRGQDSKYVHLTPRCTGVVIPLLPGGAVRGILVRQRRCECVHVAQPQSRAARCALAFLLIGLYVLSEASCDSNSAGVKYVCWLSPPSCTR